uniref:Uncharacterized protein n=1 Tax=Anguilla anguilla TaxID=7936 RepID=A0A0E9XMX7_ANGAN
MFFYCFLILHLGKWVKSVD